MRTKGNSASVKNIFTAWDCGEKIPSDLKIKM
jgi:hypothetical protein